MQRKISIAAAVATATATAVAAIEGKQAPSTASGTKGTVTKDKAERGGSEGGHRADSGPDREPTQDGQHGRVRLHVKPRLHIFQERLSVRPRGCSSAASPASVHMYGVRRWYRRRAISVAAKTRPGRSAAAALAGSLHDGAECRRRKIASLPCIPRRRAGCSHSRSDVETE